MRGYKGFQPATDGESFAVGTLGIALLFAAPALGAARTPFRFHVAMSEAKQLQRETVNYNQMEKKK